MTPSSMPCARIAGEGASPIGALPGTGWAPGDERVRHHARDETRFRAHAGMEAALG